jgi:hypothetical protein
MSNHWVSSLAYNGVEFVMVRVEWAQVKNPRDRPMVFRSMEAMYPGKHIVLVSRDPLSKSPSAEFFGHPQLIAPLSGHKMTDFPWAQVKGR